MHQESTLNNVWLITTRWSVSDSQVQKLSAGFHALKAPYNVHKLVPTYAIVCSIVEMYVCLLHICVECTLAVTPVCAHHCFQSLHMKNSIDHLLELLGTHALTCTLTSSQTGNKLNLFFPNKIEMNSSPLSLPAVPRAALMCRDSASVARN